MTQIKELIKKEILETIESSAIDNSTADVNGIYNNFCSRNSNRTLTDMELEIATTAISRIINESKCKTEFLTVIQYLATASVSATIQANSRDTSSIQPLLYKLDDVVVSII